MFSLLSLTQIRGFILFISEILLERWCFTSVNIFPDTQAIHWYHWHNTKYVTKRTINKFDLSSWLVFSLFSSNVWTVKLSPVGIESRTQIEKFLNNKEDFFTLLLFSMLLFSSFSFVNYYVVASLVGINESPLLSCS